MPDHDRRTARIWLVLPPTPLIDHDQQIATAATYDRQQAVAVVALDEVMTGLSWSEAEVRAARREAAV